MFVYLHGEREIIGRHKVYVCPAADKEGLAGSEAPAEWFEAGTLADGKPVPRSFTLVFMGGRCEVDENMGRYLVKRGIAHKHAASGLITRVRDLVA